MKTIISFSSDGRSPIDLDSNHLSSRPVKSCFMLYNIGLVKSLKENELCLLHYAEKAT